MAGFKRFFIKDKGLLKIMGKKTSQVFSVLAFTFNKGL